MQKCLISSTELNINYQVIHRLAPPSFDQCMLLKESKKNNFNYYCQEGIICATTVQVKFCTLSI